MTTTINKTIGIIGSRRRDGQEAYDAIWQQIQKWYEPGDKICSGGCPKGGDRFAEIIARKLGLSEEKGDLIIHRPEPVPKGSPRWAHAKVNYERNTLIAQDSDVIIATVAPDRKGGTEDTIRKFTREGKDSVNVMIV
jgi:hypothetical protein